MVIGLLVALVSSPPTLSFLGAEHFGVWWSISSLLIALQFIDLCALNGLVNVISAAHGRVDSAAIRHAGSRIWAFSVESTYRLIESDPGWASGGKSPFSAGAGRKS